LSEGFRALLLCTIFAQNSTKVPKIESGSTFIFKGAEADAMHMEALFVSHFHGNLRFKMRNLILHVMALLIDIYWTYPFQDHSGSSQLLKIQHNSTH
jgi:hypothetical protein